MRASQIHSLSFQDVIGKQPKPAQFTIDEMKQLSEERFLVTGAGGSIGSRIVNFISSIPNLKYYATDRDETALHSLSLKLTSSALFDSENFGLLDIRDYEGVEREIARFEPTVIIHAAALKHLSVLQKQPREATLTNVFGTANLLKASETFGLKKFVNISTDKAADPRSVLGFSKHITELMTAEIRREHNFDFTSCRFGNVFNSRGSVIETFMTQMLEGSPITLTDESVSRFFMHVDEAAHLTIKSMLINSGDVHVFDMGDPILIKNIVMRMQELLNTSSQIILTGLRNGEKLNEKLVEKDLAQLPTENPDITTIHFDEESFIPLNRIKHAIEKRDEKLVTNFISIESSIANQI